MAKKKYKNVTAEDTQKEPESVTVEVADTLEADAPEEAAAKPADSVEFDSWYAARESAIPRHHYKEILKADFRARGVGASASMVAYDEALKKYGVKLAI